MGGHWTLAQVPSSSTLSTVCTEYEVLCMHLACSPQSPLGISLGAPPPSLTLFFINFVVIVGVLESGSLSALPTREFVPWTPWWLLCCVSRCRADYIHCRICARYPGHTGHMPAGAIHVALAASPKGSQKSWHHRTCGSKRKSTLRRHPSQLDRDGNQVRDILGISKEGGRGIAWF